MNKKSYSKPMVEITSVVIEEIITTSANILEWDIEDEWDSKKYDVFEF